MSFGIILRRGLCAAVLACVAPLAAAQQNPLAVTAAQGSLVPVGRNPAAIALDLATQKLYISNRDDNTVTILNASSFPPTPLATVAVGRAPGAISVNTDTDAVYVSNDGDGTMSVIDARTNQVRSTSTVQVGGPMAIDFATNHMFMLRVSPSDEFNIVVGDTFLQASATRSYAPVAIAMNPVTNRLFVAHEATADVVPFDMTGDKVYPTRECPDGSGGLKPDSGQSNPNPGACITGSGFPVGVAVNPVTNRAYALTSTGQLIMIQGPNMTTTRVDATALGGGTGPVSVAADPVTNTVFAVFSNRVVLLNGDTLAPISSFGTTSGNFVAFAFDPRFDLGYAVNSNGTFTWFQYTASGAASGVSPIPADARGIALDPAKGIAYVVSASGVSTLYKSNFTPTRTNAISVSVRAFTGNQSTPSGTLTFNASSAMSPAPLNTVRNVFYRIYDTGSGPAGMFQRATPNGDGTYSATFSLPSNRTYAVEAIATNGLEMDSIDTDKVHVPISSPLTTYTWTANLTGGVTAPLVKRIRRFDLNADGRKDLMWRNAGTKQTAGWLMNGTQILDGRIVSQPNGLPNADIVETADFTGDGKGDLLWYEANNGWFITPMDGLATTGTSFIQDNLSSSYFATGDFDGDGRMDVLFVGGNRNGSKYYPRLSKDGSTPSGTVDSLAPAGYIDGKPVLIADLNGDGRDDVVFLNTDGSVIYCGMDATGLQCGTSGTIRPAGNDRIPVAAGDFNGDGKVDIVWQAPDGSTSLWLMDGANVINSTSILGANTGWHVVAAPDLNGDGKADLLFAHDDGSYAGWLMNGLTPTAYKVFFGGGTGWHFAKAADLNGDGKADLVWRHDDGRYGPWIMNGLDATAYGIFFGAGTGWEIR